MGRVIAWGALVVVALLAALAPAAAQAQERNFAVRFSANEPGDIVFAANSIVTCSPTGATGGASCPAARNGSGNNNDFNPANIDVVTTDSFPNSSSATLSIPAGATVLFAGLYWGSEASNTTQRSVVQLRTPASTAYNQITATQLDTSSTSTYQGFRDVTGLVQAGGAGVYTVADIKTTINASTTNRYGGWTLVVAYRSGTQPPRNLTVFDGLLDVSSSNPNVSIPLSGFLTPPAGTVNSRLGVVAYDGDLGPGSAFTGDSLRLNNQTVSDAVNPATNFFNSTISRLGALVTDRSPSYTNTLGFDADIADASGRIPNSATSATIQLTTAGETYFPGVVTIATELYAPVINPTKTVVDVNGGDVEQGDVLEYRIAGTNTGQDAATQLRLTDPIPSGVTYVAGSLSQQSGAPAPVPASRTDAAGDDNAEYDAANNRVLFRVGTGATATSGGTLAANGGSFEVRFRVRVNNGQPPGRLITNQASLNYVGQQTGTVYSNVTTPPADSTVRSPDLSLAKTHTGAVTRGSAVTYLLTVTNAGDGRQRGTVTVTDRLPAGVISTGTPTGTGWTCSVSGQQVTCTRSDELAAGASYPTISVPVRIAQDAPASLVNGAAVDGQGDANVSNNSATDPLTATSSADVRLAKQASSGTASVGDVVTFTLAAVNDGPTNATGVSLSDPLPQGFAFESATASQGTCSGTSTVTCALGTVAAGASATVTIRARVTSAAAGSVAENVATVVANESDPNPNDNTARATVTVASRADVSITKALGPAPLVAGRPVTFTLTARNAGPNPATNVVVEDAIPASVTGTLTVTTDPGSGSCTTTNRTVRCTFASLPANGTARVTVTGTLDPASAGTTLTNTATVTAAEPDPTPADRTATVSETITGAASLSVTKVDSPDPVAAGGTLTYAITVRNTGPSVARTVTLRDPLPAAVTLRETPAGCSLAAGTLTCALGDLAPGGERVVSLTTTVDAGRREQIVNTATATSATPDPAGTTASDTATTRVEASADVSLTKTAAPTTVAAGESVLYTLTYTNDGPSSATDARVTDTLPAGLTALSASPASDCATAGQTVSCALGTVAAGQSRTVTIRALVAADRAAGTVVNSATATSDTPDPDAADRTASASVTVQRRADLAVIKTADNDTVRAGERVRYRLELVNRGPSTAESPSLTDDLPDTLTSVSVEPGSPTCSVGAGAGPVVTCAFDDLAPGARRVVNLSATVSPAAPGTLVNTATGSSATPDPDSANNAGTVTTAVRRVAEVSIEKTVSPNPVVAGSPVTFTLRTRNSGPGQAESVVLTDSVPAAVTGLGIGGPDAGACTRDGQDVRCEFGALAPDGERVVTISGTLASTFSGELANRATVTTTTTDPTAADDTDVAVSDTTASADLRIAKSGPATVRAGTDVPYVISVENLGPSTARDVQVRDVLPAGLSPVSVLPTDNCVAAGRTVTCSFGPVAPGGTRRIDLVARLDPGFTGTSLTNEATVDTETADTDTGNDVASATSEVVAEADLQVSKLGAPDPVIAGEAVTYTVRVENTGPAVARDVTLVDAVPAAVAITSVSPSAQCPRDGNRVECAFGDITPGGSRTVTITGTVGQDAAGTLRNTATADSATADPDPTDDAAAATTTVERRAALVLTKSDSPDPARSGEALTYTLDVRNDGPSSAEDVVVEDTLPAAFTPTSVTGAACVTEGRTVICRPGRLDAGATRSIAITGTVDPAFAGTLRNVARATTTTPLPTPGPVVAETTTQVDAVADVTLVKEVSPGTVNAGETVTYALTATNTGPAVAREVRVTDTFPSGVVPIAGSCVVAGQVADCPLGQLAPGETRTVRVTALVDADRDAGTATNSAAVTTGTTDLDLTDNAASAPLTITRAADLRIDKTATPDPVVAGERVTYRVEVVNDGPSTARDVAVTDVLPEGLSDVRLEPAGACTVADGTVTCPLGTLAPGARRTLVASALVAPAATGPITNRASVGSSTADPDPGDDTDAATVRVDTRADIAVAKTSSPAAVVAGEELAYDLTVSNAGPSLARAVTLADVLPEAFVAASVDDPGCRITAGELVCDLGDVAAGSPRTVRVSGSVDPRATRDLVNTARVNARTFDPQPSDDTATATTRVAVAADLSILKTASEPTVAAGRDVRYTLTVANDGPSSATATSVVDTLPEGLVPTAVTPSGPCTIEGPTVACSLGELPPGQTRTIVVDARVGADVSGTVANTARVTSAAPDPDAGDTSSTAVINVTPQANMRIVKTAGPDPVTAGQDVTYTLRVGNEGPSVAREVVVEDELPQQILTTPAPTASAPCTVTGRSVQCLLGSFAPGEERTLTITGRVAPTVSAGDVFANAARVSTITNDPRSLDNTSTATSNSTARADLVVTKAADGPARAGRPLSYLITLRNEGPSTATDVDLIERVPAALRDVTVTPSTRCDGTGTIACRFASLGPGEQVEVTVTGTVDPSATGTLVNTAEAVGRPADPTPDDASATTTTPIASEADLRIEKLDDPDPAVAGRELRYEIVVTNDGPATAFGATVTDVLPPELLSPTADPAGGCTVGATLTCSIGDVAPGERRVVTVRGTLAPGTSGSIANTATVRANNDPDPSDDSATATTAIRASADVGVTKTADPAELVPGRPQTYVLTAVNRGPSTARDVVVTDALPAGLTATSATAPCEIGADGTVTCPLGDLEVDETRELRITADTDPGLTGEVTNRARIATRTADPDPADDVATLVTPVASAADLSLVKDVAPASVAAGETATFRLTVRNDGPSVARGVRVRDTLPAALAVVSASSAGICDAGGRDVVCDLGDLGPGAVRTVTIVATVDPATEGGTLTNTARVTSPTADPDAADRDATATLTVTEAADLRITKTDSADPVRPGEGFTYTVAVRNAGPSVARAAELRDPLPAGVTPNALPAGCTLDGRTVVCALGNLQPGARRVFDLGVEVDPSATGELTNTARATSDTPDPDGGPATATERTELTPEADLELAKAVSPASAAAGEQVTYTLALRNRGPSTAVDAVVRDAFPEGVQPLAVSPASDCAVSGQSVVCRYPQLEPGAQRSITVTARLAAGLEAGTVVNQATATSPTTDPDPADDGGAAPLTVDRRADLEVVKRDLRDPVRAGEEIAWEIDVRNDGPSVARDVRLLDDLPDALLGVVVTPAGDCALRATPDAGAGDVECAFGDLAPGARRTVRITARVDPAFDGTLENAASVSSDTPDADAADNRSVESTVVDRQADLRIEKGVAPNPVVAGSPVTFTIRVENQGPGTADDVVVTDAIPSGVTITSVQPSPLCTLLLGTLTCRLGPLAPGRDRLITVTGTLDAGFTGTLTNTARVDSPTPDPGPDDDVDEAVSDVDAIADLSVDKRGPAAVRAGTEFEYAIDVRNAGPSAARDVDLEDLLPPGLRVVSLDPAGPCNLAADRVRCALGTLAADTTRTVRLRVALDPGTTAPTLANTATVTSDTSDPDTADLSDTQTSTVAAEADIGVLKFDDPDPVVPGEELTYTVVLVNDGPAVARGVTLSDPLPAGLTPVAVDPAGACSIADRTVSCDVGELAPGARRTVRITAAVGAGVTGSVTNQVTAATTTTDPDPADDSATATTRVAPRAALALTKTDSPDPVRAGEQLTYTLQLTNEGPSDAADVELSDPLPAALTNPVLGGASASACELSATALECGFDTVPAGATRTVTIRGVVDPAFSGELVNTARATTDTPGTPPAGVAATARTTVAPAADLAVTSTASPDAVRAGDTTTFTVTVRNDGPGVARGTRLTDALPAGIVPVSATAAGGECTLAVVLVDCSLGTLAPGEERVVTIVVAVDPAFAGDSFSDAATITSDAPDPDLADNASAASVAVTRSADLRIVKTDTPDPVTAGERVGYVIEVTNRGPSTARAATVEETLPAALGDIVLPRGCTPVANGSTTCSLGDLAPGETVTLRIDARVDPETREPLVNTATVDSETPDPAEGNNADEERTAVRAFADLSVRKRSRPASVAAGEDLSYELVVVNAGPSTATSARLRDPLPEGFTATAVDTPGCAIADRELECAFGDLAPGGTRTIVVTGAVDPGRTAELRNTATVESATADPAPADNADTAVTPVEVRADLSLTKVASSAEAVAGGRVTWTLTVTNDGPSDATDVRLEDVLPAGATPVVVSPSSQCAADAGAVRCGFGTLAPGATRTITIRADIAPGTTGDLVNTATLTSPSRDPDTADRSATSTVRTVARANVRLVKRASPNPVLAGEELTYTLRVVNEGPSDARDAVVTDALPEQLLTSPAITASSPCLVAGRDVRCELGTLAAGAERVLTVKGTVDPDAAGEEIVNTARVDSTTADPVPDDNADTEDTNAAGEADLVLTKTADGAAQAGRPLSYTLTLRNAGPSTATSVEVVDRLPAELLDVTTPNEECAIDGRSLECSYDSLASGEVRTITVSGTVDPDATGSIVNRAEADGIPNDPDPGNSVAEVTTPVGSLADVRVAKVDDPDPAVAGGPISYTVTVVNDGPATARAVEVADTVPGAVTDPATDAPGCRFDGRQMSCRFDALSSGEERVVRITGRLDPATASGALVNTVTVTADNDGTPANNTATATTTVVTRADLSIAKQASPDPIVPGEEVVYSLVARNAGPSTATDVVVADTLPPGLTPTAAPGCTIAGATVFCTRPALAPGDAARFEITASADPALASSVVNAATVTSSTTDPDTDDNVATIATPVAPRADLRLTKSASPTAATAGETVAFTLAVVNDGPSVARGVTLEDTLPPGLSVQSIDAPPGVECATEGREIDCVLGDLQPIGGGIGASRVVTVIARIASTARGTLTNVARVRSATPDPDPTDDEATADVAVTQSADLVLEKTVDRSTARAGEELTYTLTLRNDGPSTAPNAMLTDTLPTGVSVRSITPESACATAGRTVTCGFGDLAPGATRTVTLTVLVDPARAAGTLTNTATAASDASDPTPATDSAAVTISRRADLSVSIADSPDPAVAGGALVYGVTVANRGPSTAEDPTVAITLPVGLTLSAAVPGCTLSGRVLTCELADLEPGEQVVIRIEGRIDPSVTGTLAVTAAVVTATEDPVATNDADTATTSVDARAPLTIDKSLLTSGPIYPGDAVRFGIRVRNAGPSTARGVVVADDLPDDLALESVDDGGATCTDEVRCTVGVLAPDEEAVVTVTARVRSTAGGATVSNTATAFGSTPGSELVTDAAEVAVVPEAGLSVVKTIEPDPPSAGAPVAFAIDVKNNGPSIAREIVVTDDVPDAVTGVGATVAAGSGDCTIDGQAVRCVVDALEVGGTAKVRVTGTLSANAAGTVLRNTARATQAGADRRTADNTSTVERLILPAADLSVVKTGPDTVPAGATGTYRLVVRNAGPSGQDARVVDRLPAGVTYESGPAGCTASAAGTIVTCELGALAAGAERAVEIVVRFGLAAAGTRVTNTAEVLGDVADPNSANNVSSATTRVGDVADLAVAKLGPARVTAGGGITWVIDVANRGPQASTGVVLVDDLPEGVTPDSVTASRGTCTVTGRAVRCDLGTIAEGTSAQVTVTGTTGAGLAGRTISNTATVTSAVPDARPADNSATATTSVLQAAPTAGAPDLRLTKQLEGDLIVGRDVAYVITVRNAGRAAAPEARVTDRLPTKLEARSASSSRGDCEIAENTVTCSVGTVEPQESVTVRVVARVLEKGTVENSASVVSSGSDSRGADNSDTAPGRARAPRASLWVTKSASRRTVRRGEALTYRIRVRNASRTRTARSVEVCDLGSRRFSFVRAPGARFRAGRPCWRRSRLAPGRSFTVTLTVFVYSDAPLGSFSNRARVTASNAIPRSDRAGVLILPARVAQPGGGVTG